jgi:glycosyltransferase involved in cell wall biosynthesis
MPTVGVSIASIPPRHAMLARALASVCAQTWEPDQIVVHIDHEGVGAAEAKNRALAAITTDWVAFLDDDDELLPRHLEALATFGNRTGADLVYPWFEGINTRVFSVPDAYGRLVSPYGQAWIDEIHIPAIRTYGNWIPTTVLCKTALAQQVGGFVGRDGPDTGDDYLLWLRLLEAGAKFAHLPEITWTWHGHQAHTSGQRWKDTNAYKRSVEV